MSNIYFYSWVYLQKKFQTPGLRFICKLSPIFLCQQVLRQDLGYIRLTQKFIWVFLAHLMEKPK